MRLFQLHRDVDSSGVSGIGVVAEGVVFENGGCVIHWLTKESSLGIYESIDQIVKIHGHEGNTRVVWMSVTTPKQNKGAPGKDAPCPTCGKSPRTSRCPLKCDEYH